MNPGEVAPNLQIAQIPLVESGQRRLGTVDAEAAFEVQLVVSQIRANHVVDAGHEEMVQQIAAVRIAETVGGRSRDLQVSVRRAVFGVSLQLLQQAWNQIDRAPELGDFLDVQGHPVVVLRAVQSNPGHQVFFTDVVRVVRLMLMPK